MSTTKSTGLSKPSKRKLPVMRKEFDMSPAGQVVLLSEIDKLPIEEGSKLTHEHLKSLIKRAATGDWCSYYMTDKWYNKELGGFYAGYNACHYDVKEGYKKSFYLDCINWQKLPKESVEQAKKIYNMLVSKDSPWADALVNSYLIYDDKGEKLLAVYCENLGKAVPQDCKRLFVNLMIALRCVSEHRTNRDAWKKPENPFATLLGWFIHASVEAGWGHTWVSSAERGKSWVEKLFMKMHSFTSYGDGKDIFTSYCNNVYSGGGTPSINAKNAAGIIKEVEKELGYNV